MYNASLRMGLMHTILHSSAETHWDWVHFLAHTDTYKANWGCSKCVYFYFGSPQTLQTADVAITPAPPTYYPIGKIMNREFTTIQNELLVKKSHPTPAMMIVPNKI